MNLYSELRAGIKKEVKREFLINLSKGKVKEMIVYRELRVAYNDQDKEIFKLRKEGHSFKTISQKLEISNTMARKGFNRAKYHFANEVQNG